jgi:hypothetical protein
VACLPSDCVDSVFQNLQANTEKSLQSRGKKMGTTRNSLLVLWRAGMPASVAEAGAQVQAIRRPTNRFRMSPP